MTQQDSISRARTAITAMQAHPAATRRPTPSTKAARAALRPLDVLTRAARRREGLAGQDLVNIAVRDALADAFHLGRTLAVSSEDLEDLHAARIAGRAFPARTTDDVALLAYYVGNLRHLAASYELDEIQLLRNAEGVYKHEIA
ncbi:hypothetical protein [Streptomyces parvus]|uniref:hypothetical protein n=1 Tax=Streptomyces parvus TaxID=66428 RepID=UPI0035D7B11E